MENDDMEMKKRKKLNIFMQFVCLSLATRLLFPRKPKKNRTNLKQDAQSHG